MIRISGAFVGRNGRSLMSIVYFTLAAVVFVPVVRLDPGAGGGDRGPALPISVARVS